MKRLTRNLAASAAVLLVLGAVQFAVGDRGDDEHEDGDHDRRFGWVFAREDVRPVTNATYAEECSGCHMAYQPGLLPAAAWGRIMASDALAHHYGDDASLAEARRSEIAAYLQANSADQASRSRSRAFSVGSGGTGPLPRITETRYFHNEHHEIPVRMVAGNSSVGSFANCSACHQGAAEGVYNEHRVRIPGFDRWED